MNQKITFLTFGSESYYKQVNRLSSEVKQLNIFDNIIGLSDQDLLSDTDFWIKQGDFFTDKSNSRGFGYYFWKPYIIMNTLGKIKHNDILIYIDSGCTINHNGKTRILEYISMLNSQDKYGVMSFQMEHLPEFKYTKRALFDYIETSYDDMMSGQCMATVVIIKKNDHSIGLVNEWFRIASIRNMINDMKGPEKEHSSFIDHRHDQSIYSLLVKKYGSIKIPDETYFGPLWSKGYAFPFWATRIRN